MNRNIITSDDIAQIEAAKTAGDPNQVPKALREDPPAGDSSPAPGNVTVPTADDYLTKLVKFVPLEVLGAYLFIAGAIEANVTDKSDVAWWLGGLLVGVLLLTIPYDIRVLNVTRWSQVAVSLVGLTAYVFAVGGWFATTTWYESWYATIVLPLFALVVAIIELKPLST